MKIEAILKIKLQLCDKNRSFGEIMESVYQAIKERDGVEGFEII